MIDRGFLAEAEELQLRYIAALDGRDMLGWLGCFSTTSGAYECITAEGIEQNLPMAMMLDDCPARLRDRVKFVTEIWSGTYEDYATRHFVQRLHGEMIGSQSARITSNFLVSYTSAQRHSEILASGSYVDDIELHDGAALFRSKRAILDTVTLPRYLVYPI